MARGPTGAARGGEGADPAQRRARPPAPGVAWVPVEKNYVFETDDGKKTLAELFAGRSHLLVYHFMFGTGSRVDEQNPGCTGCSFVADHFDAVVPHLNARDVTLVAESIASLEGLRSYKERMGWSFPWVSSLGSDFRYDYGGVLAAAGGLVAGTGRLLRWELWPSYSVVRIASLARARNRKLRADRRDNG